MSTPEGPFESSDFMPTRKSFATLSALLEISSLTQVHVEIPKDEILLPCRQYILNLFKLGEIAKIPNGAMIEGRNGNVYSLTIDGENGSTIFHHTVAFGLVNNPLVICDLTLTPGKRGDTLIGLQIGDAIGTFASLQRNSREDQIFTGEVAKVLAGNELLSVGKVINILGKLVAAEFHP